MTLIGTRARGDHAEELAAKYLNQQKLKLQERNYYCRVGEIDLIMRDQDYLVFVEVRYRKQANFGGALESIDRFKQAKLRRAAEHYLVHSKNTNCPCRFDVVCVDGDLRRPNFEWIKNAF